MGDLIGERLDGTLYYAGRATFDALAAAPLSRPARAAAFAGLCRINTLYMIARAGSGHIGSSFSSLDVVSHMLLHALPDCAKRDGHEGFYFSSKGHDAPGLYAAMVGLGRLPEAALHSLRRLDGLPGHPDVTTDGIVTNTGSLGMGISKAKGMIRAHRERGERRRVVVLTGDGELQEGQIWESLGGAVHAQMDELLVVVDSNKLQSDTFVRATSDLGDLAAKFRAFGFVVSEVDGHDHVALADATAATDQVTGRPQVIIAHTIKGQGVSFMQHTALASETALYRYHSGAPDAESYQRALRELSTALETQLAAHALDLPPLVSVEIEKAETTCGQRESLVAAYANALVEIGEARPEVTVLDADLAVDMGLQPFKQRFPDRFVECGIAEMDMVSQAGGLALRGRLPIAHSFACFLSARANEQLYNNASEQTRTVYVGGLAGLLPAGPGHSHQGVRDVAALGAIPGMTCIQPSDAHEVGLALDYALTQADGPVYLRMCSMPVARPYPLPNRSQLVRGRGTCLREGDDGAIITHGPVMLAEAYRAAEAVSASGDGELAVYALPFLNVIDPDWLYEVVSHRSALFTLDDHYLDGGQGQRVVSMLLELGLSPVVQRFGVVGWPACGAPEEVLRYHGLDAQSLAGRMRERLHRVVPRLCKTHVRPKPRPTPIDGAVPGSAAAGS